MVVGDGAARYHAEVGRTLAYVMFRLRYSTAGSTKRQATQVHLATVCAYDLSSFVPRRAWPAASEGRKISWGTVGPIPIDTWSLIASFCDAEDVVHLGDASVATRSAFLNDVVCQQVMRRDQPLQLRYLQGMGFTRFADYFRFFGARGVVACELDGLRIVSYPYFMHDLPVSDCRYLVADVRCFGLRHLPPEQKPGQPVEIRDDERPRVGVLWTPAMAHLRERTAYAMCYKDTRRRLATIAAIEARDASEVTTPYVHIRIPRRFRADLVLMA